MDGWLKRRMVCDQLVRRVARDCKGGDRGGGRQDDSGRDRWEQDGRGGAGRTDEYTGDVADVAEARGSEAPAEEGGSITVGPDGGTVHSKCQERQQQQENQQEDRGDGVWKLQDRQGKQEGGATASRGIREGGDLTEGGQVGMCIALDVRERVKGVCAGTSQRDTAGAGLHAGMGGGEDRFGLLQVLGSGGAGVGVQLAEDGAMVGSEGEGRQVAAERLSGGGTVQEWLPMWRMGRDRGRGICVGTCRIDRGLDSDESGHGEDERGVEMQVPEGPGEAVVSVGAWVEKYGRVGQSKDSREIEFKARLLVC